MIPTDPELGRGQSLHKGWSSENKKVKGVASVQNKHTLQGLPATKTGKLASLMTAPDGFLPGLGREKKPPTTMTKLS